MYEYFERLSDTKRNVILESGIREFSQKTYSEASTDTITRNGNISKGLLFHYFGTKSNFYLYCLEKALQTLIVDFTPNTGNDFYDVVFSSFNNKIELAKRYPDEMHFINMASRESNASIQESKNELLKKYVEMGKKNSFVVYTQALQKVDLKDKNNPKVLEALMLYTTSIMNKYLIKYQETPDEFFKDMPQIQKEIKEYLDFLINGIAYGISNVKED